jgi:hypothetical protein
MFPHHDVIKPKTDVIKPLNDIMLRQTELRLKKTVKVQCQSIRRKDEYKQVKALMDS